MALNIIYICIINRQDCNIGKVSKIKICKTLIRPVVTYTAEVTCFRKKDEEQLRVFERRILRTVLGPIKINPQQFRNWMNHEILEVMNGDDIVLFIKGTG